MKKINLNKTSCIGCGACVAICGEHFEFDDNGLSTIIKQLEAEPSNELLEAIDSCPTNAISLVDVEEVKENESDAIIQSKSPKDLITEQETSETESMTDGQSANHTAENEEY